MIKLNRYHIAAVFIWGVGWVAAAKAIQLGLQAAKK